MNSRKNQPFVVSAGTLLLLAASLHAQTITLQVDAREAPLKVIHVREQLPVAPGPLTLYYPKWIPGLHQPGGPIASVTGLHVTAGASGGTTGGTTEVPWRRDLRDVFRFHVNVPAGTRTLDVAFDFLAGAGGPAGGSATAKWLALNWYQVVLYPAGVPAAQLTCKTTLRLPAQWKFGTALPVARQAADAIEFEPVTLSYLIDSPLVAGEYYRVFDLTPAGEPIHHEIDVVAESEAALAMPPDVQRGLTSVVAESGKLFGARHYKKYNFLLVLSDRTAHFGVEHHESNESRLGERVFLGPGAAREVGGLLAHEFAHSWSGKFRRPANQVVPDYQAPLETDLLWVYEGNTSFLGNLLAARSGMWTADDYRQSLATTVASLGLGRPGRTWRPLLDTAVAVAGGGGAGGGGGGWTNWRRGSDYYEEGELLWLEVAAKLHELSGGKASIEDFLRAFYGGENRGAEIKGYTLDDLVRLLQRLSEYDWRKLIEERLNSTSAAAPVASIEASGWKLEFTDEPTRTPRSSRGVSSTVYTLGLSLGSDGTVTDALYDGPAFKAGIRPGMKLAAVNDRVYSSDVLADAMATRAPIRLLVLADDYYKTCTIEARAGPAYPRLVRDSSKPDYLAELVRSH